MLYHIRKQLVEVGFEAVKLRVTPAVARIFDGEKEAKLIALAFSKVAKGPRKKLSQTASAAVPGAQQRLRGRDGGRARVYMRPHDSQPVPGLLDQTSKHLIAETRVPIPMRPGRATRLGYEYET
jgi:hypothetical protein